MLKQIVQWGLGLGVLYASACAIVYWQQARFIFVPSSTIEDNPAKFGKPYEEVWLPIQPSGRLYGWWVPAKGTKTLLYLHGSGANIGLDAKHVNRFNDMDLSVFSFDYRGYGQSEGAFPSETAVYADAQRAWNYLTQERKIPSKDIFIYGHSLGGAIAIDLATHHPDAAGLIVQSSFTSGVDMARNDFWTAIFPADLLLKQRFESINKVPKIKLPVLFLHGEADRRIPFSMSDRLFAASGSPHKQLRTFAGADHDNVAEIAGAAYMKVVTDFISQPEAVSRQESGRSPVVLRLR
jgi:uncharacterized protein